MTQQPGRDLIQYVARGIQAQCSALPPDIVQGMMKTYPNLWEELAAVSIAAYNEWMQLEGRKR